MAAVSATIPGLTSGPASLPMPASPSRSATLAFPSVHLGSFEGMTRDNFPLTTSPSRQPAMALPAGPSRSRSYSPQDHDRMDSTESAGPSRFRGATSGSEPSWSGGRVASAEDSGSRRGEQGETARASPSLPPPRPSQGMPPLPPLPTQSPRDQIRTPTINIPRSSLDFPSPPTFPIHRTSSSSSGPASSPAGPQSPASLSSDPARTRPLGPSLTIHVPSHSPHPMSPNGTKGGSLPPLKDSPGIPRRRTIVETPASASRASPVRVSTLIERSSPPLSRQPSSASHTQNSLAQESSIAIIGGVEKLQILEKRTSSLPQLLTMPIPRIARTSTDTSATPAMGSIVESPAKNEPSGTVLEDSATSPQTPTSKRSLPRPPSERNSLVLRSTTSSGTLPAQPGADVPSSAQAPAPAPVAGKTWPPLKIAKSNMTLGASQATTVPTPQLKMPTSAPSAATAPGLPAAFTQRPMTQSPAGFSPTVQLNAGIPSPPQRASVSAARRVPAPTAPGARHQPGASASSMPVIAGLADGGPYPAGPSRTPALQPTLPAVGLGRPGQKPQPPQEEICLECMMRDRDLADVNVQGEGVWERSSDADWNDFRWREESLLKQMEGGPGSNVSHTIPSLDHSSDSESESTSASPRSTGNSLEDVEARKRLAARKQRREASRYRRKEADWRIVTEVGWRGFGWEEGATGEGLPKGFRGGRGGPLTEAGIKAVMTKVSAAYGPEARLIKQFPHASQLRYANLQVYLAVQAALVREVAAEAQRIGRFPFPEELAQPLGSNVDGTAAASAAGLAPRGSSIGWDGSAPQAIEIREQLQQAFSTLPLSINTPLMPLRPSPSSPANLASPARISPVTAAPRPQTHYIRDREPLTARTSTLSVPIKASPSAVGATIPPRHVTEEWPADDEELWSPAGADSGGIRPFSFAVRAGATGGASSNGHGSTRGRRSFFGRFGGSVTSLFGGSHNGSGSMMDMHLGLETDRRDNGSQQVHGYTRAISLASPARPGFFGGRDSRAGSVHEREHVPGARLSKSISTSRLSQMMRTEETEDERERAQVEHGRKKKGLKGLLGRIKPKKDKSRQVSARSDSEYQDLRRDARPVQYGEMGSPLAPPPPMSYLTKDRRHGRDRSDSAVSAQTFDSQQSGQGQRISQPYAHAQGHGMRSVSAPTGGSPGSQSVSPTSSRFATTTGAKRESFASRRLSGFGELSEGTGNVEMLHGKYHSSPEPVHEELWSHAPVAGAVHTTHATTHGQTYPPPIFRGAHGQTHNATSSTLSGSGVETPPAVPSQLPFFGTPAHSQQGYHQAYLGGMPVGNGSGRASHQKTASDASQLSINRFKNLPPLPIPGQPAPLDPDSTSPISVDSYDPRGTAGAFALHVRGSAPHLPPTGYAHPRPAYSHASSSPGGSISYPFEPYAQPRKSYEPASTYGPAHAQAYQQGAYGRPRGLAGEVSPRLAQSMYVQPTAASSTSSFSKMFAGMTGVGAGHERGPQGKWSKRRESKDSSQGRINVDVGMRASEGAIDASVRRRGLKGLFGKGR